MSIAPFNSYTVTDLNSDEQPYVNSSTEFGYFGNLGTGFATNCNSMPTFLLTNNGIATVDASGLSILNPGIYTLNVAIDCSATNTTGADITMYFNFGTSKLVTNAIGSTIDSFGQTHPTGLYSFGDNAPTYPGIISWLIDDGTSGSFPTPSNFTLLGNNYLWYGYNSNCNTNNSFKSGILTTKITFVIDNPTIIYFNTYSPSTLKMGTSYFTLKMVYIFPVISWTLKNKAPTKASWSSIASSSDGAKLAAVVNGGYIYTSTDSGVLWKSRDSIRNWSCIASSNNGVNLVAAVNPGFIYTSTDSGATWFQKATSQNWTCITSSSSGQYLAAGITTGYIWTSSNYGLNWSTNGNISPVKNWNSITSSSNGQYLAATMYSGQVYKSANYGLTPWTQAIAVSTWTGIASDSTGQYLAVVEDSGNIYVSSNYGVNFNTYSYIKSWQNIVSDSTGQYLAAGTLNQGIYTSSDYGATWTTNSSSSGNLDWQSIASSSDGTKLAAVVNGGGIYTTFANVY